MMHVVKKIIDVQPYTLTLEFNAGEIKKVDLEKNFLQWSTTPESKFRELLDKNKFNAVKLDKELERFIGKTVLTYAPMCCMKWESKIDYKLCFPLWDLYEGKI